MTSRESKLEENVRILGHSPVLYPETTAANCYERSLKRTVYLITSSEARGLKSWRWWGHTPSIGSREGSCQGSC